MLGKKCGICPYILDTGQIVSGHKKWPNYVARKNHHNYLQIWETADRSKFRPCFKGYGRERERCVSFLLSCQEMRKTAREKFRTFKSLLHIFLAFRVLHFFLGKSGRRCALLNFTRQRKCYKSLVLALADFSLSLPSLPFSSCFFAQKRIRKSLSRKVTRKGCDFFSPRGSRG